MQLVDRLTGGAPRWSEWPPRTDLDDKHLRLITTEAGGYEWVDPADPRVSEVRLLHELTPVAPILATPAATC